MIICTTKQSFYGNYYLLSLIKKMIEVKEVKILELSYPTALMTVEILTTDNIILKIWWKDSQSKIIKLSEMPKENVILALTKDFTDYLKSEKDKNSKMKDEVFL